MKFNELLEVVSDLPVFETNLLFAGDVEPPDMQKQLSRWVRAGRVYQLRRGLYALAPPLQKIQPHPFLVANRMVGASYVSLQSALAFYGLIPEYVPVTTSITTHRKGFWETPLGSYQYRHIQISWFTGYRLVKLPNDQQAFVATPEKALLDLIYLTPRGDQLDYLSSLRLQNLENLNLNALNALACQLQSRKIERAAENIAILASEETEAYQSL